MNTTLEKLLTNIPIVTDGAWGTQLMENGLKPGECPDFWNISNPSKVENVARAYLNAGSKIILTNTFRANHLSLRSYNLDDRFIEINRKAVEILKKVVRGRALVFGSMGYTGRLFPKRVVDDNELFHIFAAQANELAIAGVDGIVIESMVDLQDAIIALRAAKVTQLPIVVSMIFDSGKGKTLTMMGNSPAEAAIELTSEGVDIIGANCGDGIEKYLPICKQLCSSTDKPIWIKPSAGIPTMIGKKIVYPTTPQNFGMYAKVMIEIGAAFIGGCCGTTPEYIKLLSIIVKSRKKIIKGIVG